jgi:catechol 2,3-dioxygenase-like lactoylglutathione lyase family enzyme
VEENVMLSSRRIRATIPAADLGRARQWYEEKLGLTPRAEVPAGLLYDLGGGTGFLLYPTSAAGKAPNTLASFTSTDVKGDVAMLRRRGVVFEDYDFPGLKTIDGVADMDGLKSAWFKDSEGNILAIGEES